ncbi:hypothetical protein AB205_0059980 [Aquarana catesbeiana]|uniref:Uncharacterized protein n=1 Tax=Aquarana catesbeiana TaxID=8400 RepID=A0A2G9PU76_AQUCT|nr:hypothetical protein AB205_0059980 [Aquarana catesbeiana]
MSHKRANESCRAGGVPLCKSRKSTGSSFTCPQLKWMQPDSVEGDFRSIFGKYRITVYKTICKKNPVLVYNFYFASNVLYSPIVWFVLAYFIKLNKNSVKKKYIFIFFLHLLKNCGRKMKSATLHAS